MKKVCLLLLIPVSLLCIGQAPDTVATKSFKPRLIPDAATAEKVAKYKDSIVIDYNFENPPPQYKDGGQYNYDAILKLQKERRAKEKRNAIIRIGIGILFLIVLVIGVRRNLKSK